MGKSDPIRNGSGRLRWLVVGLFLVLLLPAIAVASVHPLLGGVVVILALALVIAGIVRTGDDANGDSDTSSSVWGAIPRRQYDGRHVESGGLTRGEQERALEAMQEEADALDEVDEHNRP